ncbi:DUF4892 domain-containing protein [Aestuariirhabdus sp. LZHN29]|uniref:DUF4892 domain-containing protein n=1 Tax=Aestuariirhabdus sp. LZHN29 TaxID=3417462 RepID=UPI003CE91042
MGSQLVCFLGGVGMFLAAPAFALNAGVDPYPNAEVVEQRQGHENNHRLVTGSIKKINGVVRADSEYRVNGELTRVVYQIPEGHTNRRAFEHVERAIEVQGFTPLFRCEGRRCGSSNFWANEVFGIKQLYGPDNAQFYLVAENASFPGEYLLSYAIRRGNGRVYSLVEHFATDDALRARAQQEHYVEFSGWPVEADTLAESPAFRELVTLMHERSQPVILAVSTSGDASNQEDLDQLVSTSRDYAAEIARQLVGAGVDVSGFSVMGVGPTLLPGAKPGRIIVRAILL